MSTDDALIRFKFWSSIYRASRISKFRHGHIKLAYSKIIEMAARLLGIGIKRRARLFWGQEMTVVYPEPTSLATSRYGFYEEGLTTMVLQYLKPGMTFLDVGAHVGYFTLLAGWIVGDSGQVHSFEPTSSTFEVLLSNVGLSNNTYLNQVAVTSKTGMVTLNDYGPAFSGYNSMYQARMPEADLIRVKSTKFRASAISIDEYVAQERLAPNFVKIDAESSDFEVIKGMEETIKRCRPIMSVEVGDMDIEGVPRSKDLVVYLVGKGYQPFEHTDGSISKHQPRERYGYEDLLFLPTG